MLRDAAMGLFLGVPTGLAVGQVLLRQSPKSKGKPSVWDKEYITLNENAFDLIVGVSMTNSKNAAFDLSRTTWELGCNVFRLIACMSKLGDRAALSAYLINHADLQVFKDTLVPDTEEHEFVYNNYTNRNTPPPSVTKLAEDLRNFSTCLKDGKEMTSPKNVLPNAAAVVQRTLECLAYFLPQNGYSEHDFFQPRIKKDDPSTRLMWDAWVHYHYYVKKT